MINHDNSPKSGLVQCMKFLIFLNQKRAANFSGPGTVAELDAVGSFALASIVLDNRTEASIVKSY